MQYVWKQHEEKPRSWVQRHPLYMVGGVVVVLAVIAVVVAWMDKPKPVDYAKVPSYEPWVDSSLQKVARDGGLGDGFAQLQNVLGPAESDNNPMSDGYGSYRYQHKLIEAWYIEGRIGEIAYLYDFQYKQIPMAQGMRLMHNVLPPDAKLISKQEQPGGYTYYLYHSATLARLFKQSDFADNNGKNHPGDVTVLIDHIGSEVQEVRAYVGFNQVE